MKNIPLLGKVALAAAGLASAVQVSSAAAVVQYNYTGETGGGVIMGIHTADYNGGALVGEFVMTSTTPGFTTPLLTYCTDVGAFLQNSYTYSPTPITASSPTGVSPTWISGGIQNVARLWAADRNAATAGGAVTTAGLQLAIWELLYNNISSGFSFTSAANNGFYITTSDMQSLAVESYATSLLSNLANDPTPNNVEWLAPVEPNGMVGGSQGLLYETTTTTDLTPSPDAASTLGLLGLVVGALGVANRKLRRS
ncbi:MAG TPA: hypothetical protein VH413_19295 [Verrucomicrobiae bacterium]|jgi:hypothetical protein|nr:hypothetical protein [Verrucomicrobiae bacterium]